MSDNWGGFANGAIPTSAMKRVQSEWFKPDVADAIAAAIAECASKGVSVHINEGFRPLGIPADQYIRTDAQTSTGGSNQWFQYGRMNRGETPTAAYPGGSIHGWGKAADVNPGANNSVVRGAFAAHGFTFDISSETWHAHYVGGSVADPTPSSSDQKTSQQALKDLGLYSGPVDGIYGPQSWKGTQTFLKQHGLYNGALDGIPGPNTYKGFQTFAKSGGYTGAVDGILGPRSWAGFAAAIAKSVLPAAVVNPPTPAPAPEPVPAPVVPEPVVVPPVPETPVQEAPVTPETPVEPAAAPPAEAVGGIANEIPVTPPKKETPVSEEVLAAQEAAIAAQPATDLGAIIPSATGRKVAYAIYAGASLLATNTAIGFAALNAAFPAWLTVSLAVIGNLAAPFGAIAIANAPKKTT